MTSQPSRLTRRCLPWIVAGLVGVLLVVGAARATILTSLGRAMTTSDPLAPADFAVLTPESGEGGEIEVSDLFHDHIVTRAVVLLPHPTIAAAELERRGARIHDGPLDVLVQLGVPQNAIVAVSAGEGGTTESTKALSAWCRGRGADRIIVIVSPTHARRYRRALARVWQGPGPLPAIRTTRFDEFRAETWWWTRGTLRNGLGELQKLLLDYVSHPL